MCTKVWCEPHPQQSRKQKKESMSALVFERHITAATCTLQLVVQSVYAAQLALPGSLSSGASSSSLPCTVTTAVVTEVWCCSMCYVCSAKQRNAAVECCQPQQSSRHQAEGFSTHFLFVVRRICLVFGYMHRVKAHTS
jgi:hypothetical protein